MFPVLLDLGPIKLHTYGLMIAIGFLTAVWFMSRDAEKVGVKASDFSEMAFWGLLIGILGTRLAHIIMFPENYSWSNPIGWVALWNGGLVFQGAIPVVLIYAVLVLKWYKIPFWKIPDIVFPFIPIAQAFGRFGCVAYGCCYGIRAENLPWGMRFPEGSPAFFAHKHLYPEFPGTGWSYPVHPTQLYSVIGLFIISGFLLLARKHINKQGITMPLYFVFYGIMRFIVEFFRGDGNPTNLGFGVLSDQQVFCIGMVIFGLGLLAFIWQRKQPSEPAPWYKTPAEPPTK